MRSYMRAFASLFLALAIIFAGFTSPALSTAQASTRAVAVLHWAEKEKGDVIIFMDGGYACHSAIYAGDGKVWHAPKTGRKVSEEKIWTSSYVLRRPRSPSVAIAARSSPWKSAPRCRL